MLKMSSTCTSAYASLAKTYTRLHNLGHLCAMASWDSSVNMPPKGADARAAALAEVGMVMHGLKTDPSIRGLIEQAESEELSFEQRANLREIKLDWTFSNGLPVELVEQKSLLGKPHPVTACVVDGLGDDSLSTGH